MPHLIACFSSNQPDLSLSAEELPAPLILASSMASSSAVRLLLECENQTRDIEAKDNKGWTALQCAAESGSLEIVSALVESKSLLRERILCFQTFMVRDFMVFV